MAETKVLKPGTAKVKSKTAVSVNLKGVEAGGRAPRIPEGNYLAKVVSATATEAKSSGNPLVLWKFGIVGTKYEGTEIWHRTVLVPQSLWAFRQVLEALGIKVKDSTMDIPLDRLAGRTCGIQVIDGDEYEGKIKSEVNDVFRKDLLESEGEDEEDEEEPETPKPKKATKKVVEEDEEEEDEEESEEEEDEEVDLDDEDL